MATMTRWILGLGGWLVVVGGCVAGTSKIGEPLPDGSTGGSSSSSDGGMDTDGLTGPGLPETTDDSTDGSDSAGDESSSGGAQFSCPESSPCTQPIDCDDASAGPGQCTTTDSLFDADGCARQRCGGVGDSACPEGQSCFYPAAWGACQGEGHCEDGPDGTCECAFVGLVCDLNGVCVSDDSHPPPNIAPADYCDQFLDQEICDAVDLFPISFPTNPKCRWYEGYRVQEGESCEVAEPIGRCIYTHGEQTGRDNCEGAPDVHPVFLGAEDGTTDVLRITDGTFAYYTDDTPWIPCAWGDDAACECACQ